MSVDNDEQMAQDESTIEQVDVEQLAEAGADATELSTQDNAEAEIEQISAADLAGSQPETDEADKERNKLYAENRVAKKRLKELERQVDSGNIPDSYAFKPSETVERPKLTEYVNEERLYSEFNGSEALALAAYNEAKELYSEKNGSVESERVAHAESVKRQIAAQMAAENAFDESIAKHSKVVNNIDTSLERAESLLGERDFNTVRDIVGGDNAALVLATIGANDKVQAEFMEVASQAIQTGNINLMGKHLARLEDRIVSNLPSAKTISTAASENPVGGDGADLSDLDKKMNAAAQKGDVGEYRRLKKLKGNAA
jgi:hypothetical protein